MERPILFNTEMVQAILSDRKTNTRRIAKPHLKNRIIKNIWYGKVLGFKGEHWVTSYENDVTNYVDYTKPPCSVGDTLWVRETWSIQECEKCHAGIPALGGECKCEYVYRTNYGITEDDTFPPSMYKWRPSIHMPRKAARLFLKVTNVRVERIWNITEEDAKAEGVKSYWAEPHRDDAPFIGAAKELGADLCLTRREAFQQLWDSIYNNWSANPWVFVIEFERVTI